MFEGKVALVTGSSQGIGQVIATKFAEYGADVVVHGLGATDDCKTCQDIRAMGRKTAAYDVDITNVEAVNEMVKDIIAKFGKIDILINNAGMYPAMLVTDVTEKHFDRVIAVNLKGTSGVAIYGAAKAGVISLTKSFALELADYDINSNCVAPGWVESEAVLSGDRWKTYLPQIPSRRLGKLSEIAESCVFLCNDKVSYINGEILDVNGAIIMD